MEKRKKSIKERKREIKKKQFIECYKKHPNVSVICKTIGISRDTYYRWIEEDPNFYIMCNKALQQGLDYRDDLVENQYVSMAIKGHWQAVKDYMHTTHQKNKVDTPQNTEKLSLFELSRRLAEEEKLEEKRKLELDREIVSTSSEC